ncbi:unnamed protein product [Bursaphelenchus okinawaensis]|uniref:Uncharacterized protein n=1 Tax=Bursaphelenchus okinawaensis TaxID=465554 RepID=A0A811LE15_9BILA|nr:unnamed protein product [Bursaphelenchus okinawaensis]CAG9122152.1 unnamed protein product [Bursaphelenchus okinawaensis]
MSSTGGSGGVTVDELKTKCFLILRTCIFCWTMSVAFSLLGFLLMMVIWGGGEYGCDRGYIEDGTYYCSHSPVFYVAPAVIIAAWVVYAVYCVMLIMGKNINDKVDLIWNIVTMVITILGWILGLISYYPVYGGFLVVVAVIIYIICHFVIRKKN